MIGGLLSYLEQRRESRRRYRKMRKSFARWLAANPGGTFGQFYVYDTRRRIDAGSYHPTLGTESVEQEAVKARAQRVLKNFKDAGCKPNHVLVDYGCGSLWVGEAFMEYLDPGNYIGLDISETFYAEALARMPADFVTTRQPVLRVIDDAVLRETRERKPDFVLALAVLHHVPPDGMADFLGQLVSIAGPDTRIEVGHGLGLTTKGLRSLRWRHGSFAIRAALKPLGYVAECRPEHRIMPSTPGFALVRR